MNAKTASIVAALLLAACSSGSVQQTVSSGAPSSAPSNASSTITVGDPVWITKGDPDREQYEMLAGVDPDSPSHMLACTTVYSSALNARSNVIYASFDGGATWSREFEHTTTTFTGDPACTFAFNGVAYYAGLPIFGGPHITSSEQLFQSTDYGKTWHMIVSRPFQDREYITVDRTNSPYHGNVYLYADGIGRKVGNTIDGFDLFRIVNGKLTPPVLSPESKTYGSMNASEGAVARNGTLIIPFEAATSVGGTFMFQFRIARSTDGGNSLGKSQLIAPVCKTAAGVASPLAVDRTSGPFAGRVYAAYPAQNGDHCTMAVLHSDDNGATWSTPALLHEDSLRKGFPLPPNQSLATLAVNDNGIVGLSWYDTRDDPAGKAYTLRFAASYDGGESFDPSVAASPFSRDLEKSNPWAFGAYVDRGGANSRKGATNDPLVSLAGTDWNTDSAPGDTRAMLVGAGGVFHPFWYANPTGVLQLYTAPVRVEGRAARNGDPALDAFTDITNRVTLRYTSTHFDAATGKLTLGVVLVNRSTKPISGPIKVRLLWIESVAGTPIVLDAQNGKPGPGAIWDLSSSLAGGTLQPFTESHISTMQFRLNDLDPSRITFPTVTFGSRVYSGAK